MNGALMGDGGVGGMAAAVVAGGCASGARGMELLSAAAGWAAGGFVFRGLCHGVHIRGCGQGCLGVRSDSCGWGTYPFLRLRLLMVSPLRRLTFFKRQKSKQKRLPLHTAPRWGSGCPSSGIAPGARRQPAIHGRVTASSASMPSCPLRNAYARPAGKGPEDQDQDQKPKPKPRCAGGLLVAAAAGCERALALAKPGGAICQEYRGGRFSVSCGAVRSLRQRLHVTLTAMKEVGRQAAVRFCFCFCF